jgi:hypothetical protein
MQVFAGLFVWAGPPGRLCHTGGEQMQFTREKVQFALKKAMICRRVVSL